MDDVFEVMFARYEREVEKGVIKKYFDEIQEKQTLRELLNFINRPIERRVIDLEVERGMESNGQDWNQNQMVN